MENKKIVSFIVSAVLLFSQTAFATEHYSPQVYVNGDTVTWDSTGNVELQRLSSDHDWETVYTGNSGTYTDTPPEGLSYYRVKKVGENEWSYSYPKYFGKSKEAFYAWNFYESNGSGNLEYTAGKTDSGTYKIVKTSAYSSSDCIGISQTVDPEALQVGKSYTLSFEHKRIGGPTSYNQIYYSLGGVRTAISPSKNQTVDWKTATKSFTCSSIDNFDLCFYIVGVGVTLELRNIRLYETDDTTQTDILLNSDFSIEAMPPSMPEKVVVIGENAISWICDNGIVVTDAITHYPVAVFSKNKRMANIEDGNGIYVISAYSDKGLLSEPYMISLKKTNFVTGPSTYYDAEDGTVKVSINVKNTEKNDGAPIGFYTALYQSGILTNVSELKQTVPYTKNDNTFTIMEQVLNVTDDDYEVKTIVQSGNVMIDEKLTKLGFFSYHGKNEMNAMCSIVDSGDQSHGNVLQIYASGNPDRDNRYGGVEYDITLEAGKTYRIAYDFKAVGQNGADIGRQVFANLATNTHGAIWSNLVTYPDAETDWTHKSYTVSGTSAKYKVQFGVAGNFTAYFDNVKVYDVDDTSATNLLPTSTFTTAARVLAAPQNVAVSSRNYGEATLSWDMVPNAMGYTVSKSVDNSEFTEIGTTVSTSIQVVNTTGKNTYRVQAIGDDIEHLSSGYAEIEFEEAISKRGLPRDYSSIISNATGDIIVTYEKVTEDGNTKLKVSQLTSGENGDNWGGIRYTIDSSKLVAGHTYYFGFNYKKDSLNDSEYTKVMTGLGNARGPRITVEASKGDALNWDWFSRNNITCNNVDNFGIDIIIVRNASMYIDGLRCYDLTDDPDKTTNLIEHGDFEPYSVISDVEIANGMASVTVINQESTNLPVIMVSASYDNIGRLVDLKLGNQNYFEPQTADAEPYVAEVEAPSAANSEKVFIWSSIAEMKPLKVLK